MPPRELTFRGGTLVFKPRKRLCYAELFRMLNHRGEFAADCVDNDNIALVNLAAEYLLSDDGLNVALDIPLERTCAEARIVACVDYRLLCGVGDVEVKLLVLQASLEGSCQQVDDLEYLLLAERLVEHDLVKSVEELRSERLLEQHIHGLPRFLGDLALLVDAVEDILRAEV